MIMTNTGEGMTGNVKRDDDDGRRDGDKRVSDGMMGIGRKR